MKIKYPIQGFAPGNYASTCVSCKESFNGDKRSYQCEPCAINSLVEYAAETTKKLRECEVKIKDLTSAITTIVANQINKVRLKVGDVVIAPKGKYDNLTAGKEYVVTAVPPDAYKGFNIVDDEGVEIYCITNKCCYLGDKDWIIK
jgi:hypothetical protein